MAAPTRCDGFEVRDVAGHVIGLAEDVAKGVPGSRTAEEEAATVRDDTPARAADRLRAAVGSFATCSPCSTTTLGTVRARSPT